jgi:hypothetical protein
MECHFSESRHSLESALHRLHQEKLYEHKYKPDENGMKGTVTDPGIIIGSNVKSMRSGCCSWAPYVISDDVSRMG